MKPKTSFSISFVIRKDKVDTNGAVPVFMRVTITGKRVNLSTGRRVDLSKWHSGKALGNSVASRNLNKFLDSFRVKAYEIQREMLDQHEVITAESFKERFTGGGKSTKTVFEVFDYHNNQIKERIGIDYSLNTSKRFETARKHTLSFMQHHYNRKDMYLHELNFEFISAMEHYLKTVHKCNHNTTIKYIKNFRKVINFAINNEWLANDPFRNFKTKLERVEREFLTNDELNTLMTKELHPRLDTVRDVFAFCCYTGLAYAEVSKLSTDHIKTDEDGEEWIYIHRMKTKNKSTIPLLKPAKILIDKYKDDSYCKTNNVLLPVISNQKMNAYLKEIAIICGIDKNLTTHLARHTFATTVTLGNGVSMEALKGMLGHQDIRATQIYGKITQEKISKEMKGVSKFLNLNLKKQ